MEPCKPVSDGKQASSQDSSQPTGLPSDAPVKTKMIPGALSHLLHYPQPLLWRRPSPIRSVKLSSFALLPFIAVTTLAGPRQTSKRVQFNGYTPTRNYAYPYNGGPPWRLPLQPPGRHEVPNWGFHSSPSDGLSAHHIQRSSRSLDSQPAPSKSFSAPSQTATPPLPPPSACSISSPNCSAWSTTTRPMSTSPTAATLRTWASMSLSAAAARSSSSATRAGRRLNFQGIGMAIRKCRIDYGVEIKLDLTELDAIAGASCQPYLRNPRNHCYPGHPWTPIRRRSNTQGEARSCTSSRSLHTGTSPGPYELPKGDTPSLPSTSTRSTSGSPNLSSRAIAGLVYIAQYPPMWRGGSNTL